jgi:glycogen debranching enzyme
MPEERPSSVPDEFADFAAIRSKEFGLYASAGPLYGNAVFGRDSLETAEDVLPFDRGIPERVLLAMARLQGTKDDPASEEEPGRIHHEYRSTVIDGVEVNEFSRAIIADLGPRWGGDAEGFCYYGSVDATPLFLRLLAAFHARFLEQRILERPVPGRPGVTMADAADTAARWIERRIDASADGFVESKRTNPRGILNQVWQDSCTSYADVDGTFPDYRFGVASIEVQGLAYDALKGAAELAADPARAAELRERADALRSRILKRFWLPDAAFFAHAACRKHGAPALVRMPSSNAGVLLDTALFDDLPEDERRTYVSALAARMYGEEFLTEAGIRCRSARFSSVVPFADYHGAQTVWTKQGFDVAKGLRRQGFPRLAGQVETRILNGVNVAGKNYEFLYVTPDGAVGYQPERQASAEEWPRTFVGTNVPEQAQAWTVAAIFSIKRRVGHAAEEAPAAGTWQGELEESLLGANPRVGLLEPSEAVRVRETQRTPFRIDTELAITIDTMFLARLTRFPEAGGAGDPASGPPHGNQEPAPGLGEGEGPTVPARRPQDRQRGVDEEAQGEEREQGEIAPAQDHP